MSEILSNIVVEQTSINFSPDNNNLNITPEAIQLNIFTAAAPSAGQSSNGELLYNNLNLIDGVPNTSFASGNLTLGNVANIKINGGSSAYFLQTDGSGNLTWAAGTGNITGNASAAGANNQIQLSTGTGNFKAGAGFSFDTGSNILTVPGNVSASYFIGNGSQLTGIGNGNANYANFAGNVINSSQPNITSVGNLTSLTVVGTTTIQQAIEKATLDGVSATGTVNFDVLSQAILYKTANATANFTLNIRGNSTTTFNSITANGQSVTIALLNQNGITPYYANVIQIDGTTITPKYVLNNTPTSGTSTGIDQYVYNIIKTNSNTYTVLGSKIGFL
jgi:hypothetical protein